MHSFEDELLILVPRLRRFARSLAHDLADADDLTQQTVERALRAKAQWTPGTRLDAWAMKVMRNCWIDEVRSRKRRAQTFAPEEEGAQIGDDGHLQIEARAEAAHVGRAIQTLPPVQREVVALVLVEGFDYKEAAHLLEIPIGTLTSRLARARQALMRMLDEN